MDMAEPVEPFETRMAVARQRLAAIAAQVRSDSSLRRALAGAVANPAFWYSAGVARQYVADIADIAGVAGIGAAQGGGPSHPRRLQAVAAWVLAVLADSRWQWCPHPGAGVRVLLCDARRVACLACLDLARRAEAEGTPVTLEQDAVGPDRCDGCERQASRFALVVVAFGPLVLLANVCRRCHRLLVGG